MAMKHFWYSIRDDDGKPIPGESVYIYKDGTTTELNIFNSAGVQLSQPLTTTSTAPSGEFDFYVKDIYDSGYLPSQKMEISWSLGSVDDLDIFDNLYMVDETDSTDTDTNKLISNQLGYTWNTHISLPVSGSTVVHELYRVDETDSTDSSSNKLISNQMMNEFYSLLVSASTITVEASGSVIDTFTVSSWTSTTIPSAGDYYTDVTHGFGVTYPLLSVWKTSTSKMIVPTNIESIDNNTIRIWIGENTPAAVSVVG